MLRFLIASREEVSARQLRDDLLSMLVAGHETTGSVLTWTLYLLEQNPSAMAKVRRQSIPLPRDNDPGNFPNTAPLASRPACEPCHTKSAQK